MIFKHKSKLEKGMTELFLTMPLNISTFLPLFSALLFFYFMGYGVYGPALIALIGIHVNLMDRNYTRDNSRNSKFRIVVNSTLDRIADILMITAFGFADIVTWELAVIYLGLSYLNSYVRSRTETFNGVTLNNGPMTRPRRVFLVTLTCMFLYMGFETFSGVYVADLMFIAMSGLSLITLIIRFYKSYRLLEKHSLF